MIVLSRNRIMPGEPAETALVDRRVRARERALSSALVAGLGQALQGRPVSAALHFGTVVAYAVTALSLGANSALFVAVLWNAWSAIDAYRHERD